MTKIDDQDYWLNEARMTVPGIKFKTTPDGFSFSVTYSEKTRPFMIPRHSIKQFCQTLINTYSQGKDDGWQEGWDEGFEDAQNDKDSKYI
jgi:hypothetical protein